MNHCYYEVSSYRFCFVVENITKTTHITQKKIRHIKMSRFINCALLCSDWSVSSSVETAEIKRNHYY